MYEEFDSVLLKDGRYASLVNLDGPGQFSATVGDGPKDWEIITVMEEDILRKMTKEELEEQSRRTYEQYRECGIM